jgi:hypothetical protein
MLESRQNVTLFLTKLNSACQVRQITEKFSVGYDGGPQFENSRGVADVTSAGHMWPSGSGEV